MVLRKSLKKLQQNLLPYYEYKTMRAVIAHFKHLKDLGMKPAIRNAFRRYQYIIKFNQLSINKSGQSTLLMNHLLSDRINNLATSQTLAMAALARTKSKQEKTLSA
jgi:hypothetical protein